MLGREAQFSKKSRIARLPPYLAVQFVRFAWRKDTAKRAKILRTVSFPPMLDVRSLCTPLLQSRITAFCSGLEKERDAASGATVAEPAAAEGAPAEGAAKGEAAAGSSADEKEDKMDTAPVQSAEEIAALAADSVGAECGDCRTGRYELFGVITHQGRTAEGGHYVAWVKKDPKTWLVYDDETVAEISAERIKELCVGGRFRLGTAAALTWDGGRVWLSGPAKSAHARGALSPTGTAAATGIWPTCACTARWTGSRSTARSERGRRSGGVGGGGWGPAARRGVA